MTANANEAIQGQGTPIGADLHAGVEAISIEQVVTFKKYVRLVLPLDSYVFWVRADMVKPSALYNASKLNTFKPNESPLVIGSAPTVAAQGSLHFATDVRQEEAENYAVNRVVFTSEQQVQDLNEIGPNVIYIASFGEVRFAFSQRGSWYEQAQIWHYVGNAVYADMATQIIDSPRDLDTSAQIVSNSLPAWLSLNNYNPFYGIGNSIPLYPSFLSPMNLRPPFATIHVATEGTKALASSPFLDRTYNHNQLASDTVKVTLWGCNNLMAQNFVDCVNQYSTDYNVIGMLNMPIVRDEKRTQTELGVIAQKKTIEFEVSYLQTAMRDIARQLIEQAVITYYPTGYVAA